LICSKSPPELSSERILKID